MARSSKYEYLQFSDAVRADKRVLKLRAQGLPAWRSDNGSWYEVVWIPDRGECTDETQAAVEEDKLAEELMNAERNGQSMADCLARHVI